MGIAMTQTTYGIQVILRESTLTENAAYVGSNLYVTIFDQVTNSGVLIRTEQVRAYGNNISSRHMIELSAALTVPKPIHNGSWILSGIRFTSQHTFLSSYVYYETAKFH